MATSKHLAACHPMAPGGPPPVLRSDRPAWTYPKELAALEGPAASMKPLSSLGVSGKSKSTPALLGEIDRASVYRPISHAIGDFHHKQYGPNHMRVKPRPEKWHPLEHTFTTHLATCGMIRMKGLTVNSVQKKAFGFDSGGHQPTDWTKKIG
mmetsp:Transcript_8251/g.18450  ORF Transcript_8251/g.18450 Transcript_8251/m.18450 type:complete len:152 (+) Transcript_8251:103-558(+)